MFSYLISRSLPPELGDLIGLRELALSNNLLRSLPYELGKLFQLLVSQDTSRLNGIIRRLKRVLRPERKKVKFG